MGRKKPFTTEQIDMVGKMAGMRMPMEAIANILGVSKECLEKRSKKDKALKDAIDNGRTKGSMKVYQTAFQLATGYKREREVFDQEKGKLKKLYEDVPPDPNMLKFWLKTQEGWRETDRLEITGAGGGSLKIEDMTAEARREKIKQYELLQKRLESARALVEEARDVTPPPAEEPENG